MTTSVATSSISDLTNENGSFRDDCLGYFAARAQSDAHELVMRRFIEISATGNMSKAEIARLLNKRPEQVTRWLGSPGNWTIETFAHLMLALGGVPTFRFRSLEELNQAANEIRGGPVRTIHLDAQPAGVAPVATSSRRIEVEFI